jgi:hypothetical protein
MTNPQNRPSERSTQLTALAGALRETASALVQLETACRGSVSLNDRNARLEEFVSAERLLKRVRSAVRHVAKELDDEAGPVAPPQPVRLRAVKH